MKNENCKVVLFLLSVSVMLIITFLQQEFVLLPGLQNLNIIGEDARAQILVRDHGCTVCHAGL